MHAFVNICLWSSPCLTSTPAPAPPPPSTRPFLGASRVFFSRRRWRKFFQFLVQLLRAGCAWGDVWTRLRQSQHLHARSQPAPRTRGITRPQPCAFPSNGVNTPRKTQRVHVDMFPPYRGHVPTFPPSLRHACSGLLCGVIPQ